MRRLLAHGLLAAALVVIAATAFGARAAIAANQLTAEQAVALNKARADGDSLFRQRKYDEAIVAYRKATAIDSSYAPTFYNLGLSYERVDRQLDAIHALRRAIKLDDKFGPARLELAKVFIRQDSLTSAKRELDDTKTVLADSNEYVMGAEQLLNSVGIAYTNHAIEFIRKRQFKDAMKNAQQAISVAPELSFAHRVAGEISEMQDQYEAAQQQYRLAAQYATSPKEQSASYEGVGRVYMEMALQYDQNDQAEAARKARDEAIDQLRQSVAADTTNETAYINLGNTLFEAGRYNEARDALVRAEKLRPRDYRAPFKLAEVYQHLDQCTLAEAAAARAIRLQPSNASAHAARAEALECLNRKQEAIKEYEIAERDPRWRQRAEYKIKKLREDLGLPTH